MELKLKACPHCGGEAKSGFGSHIDGSEDHHPYAWLGCCAIVEESYDEPSYSPMPSVNASEAAWMRYDSAREKRLVKAQTAALKKAAVTWNRRTPATQGGKP